MNKQIQYSLASLLVGILMGAAGTFAWLARPVYEASLFSSGPVEVWYQSRPKNGAYENEFRLRKLCGDARAACSDWTFAHTLKSERPYPAKDIEFHVVGEKILMSFPDGQTIKGSLSEPWTSTSQ